MKTNAPFLLALFVIFPSFGFAADSLVSDYNSDGEVRIVAFGDSITRGVGDFIEPGVDSGDGLSIPTSDASYPLRVENTMGISVLNYGDPGETLIDRGLPRFASTIPALRPDIVFIAGGSNDGIFRSSASDYAQAAQTMINIAQASGALPILVTAPPVCCNHIGSRPYIDSYNNQLHTLAAVNGLSIADIYHAFDNICGSSEECELLNLPDGLHPNVRGYDVMGENIMATLLQIDIFAADGPTQLESALQLTPGSVITVPDATTP